MREEEIDSCEGIRKRFRSPMTIPTTLPVSWLKYDRLTGVDSQLDLPACVLPPWSLAPVTFILFPQNYHSLLLMKSFVFPFTLLCVVCFLYKASIPSSRITLLRNKCHWDGFLQDSMYQEELLTLSSKFLNWKSAWVPHIEHDDREQWNLPSAEASSC